ncbi:hypothetical protein B566_EDAN002412 [Ephemera danica]|nr:hypothetical protein B566_EDAN002412 [Ephemera danica]
MIVLILILQVNYIIAPSFSCLKSLCIKIWSCSNTECLKKAQEHLQRQGYVTIHDDSETMSFTCNKDYGLVGNSTVKCDICNDIIIGTLPTCQQIIIITASRTVPGSATTMPTNNTNNSTYTTESTTALVDGTQESRINSESNREKLSMQNLSLIVISLVLIVIIVGLITFIWLRRCKMESLCWNKQPHVNSSRVISEYDDTYDYPMMQFTTETQTIRQCGNDAKTQYHTRRANEDPSSSTSYQSGSNELCFKHNEFYDKV